MILFCCSVLLCLVSRVDVSRVDSGKVPSKRSSAFFKSLSQAVLSFSSSPTLSSSLSGIYRHFPKRVSRNSSCSNLFQQKLSLLFAKRHTRSQFIHCNVQRERCLQEIVLEKKRKKEAEGKRACAAQTFSD